MNADILRCTLAVKANEIAAAKIAKSLAIWSAAAEAKPMQRDDVTVLRAKITAG